MNEIITVWTGTKQCGCVVAAASNGMSRDNLVRSLGEMVEEGLTVKKLPPGVLATIHKCQCDEK